MKPDDTALDSEVFVCFSHPLYVFSCANAESNLWRSKQCNARYY